MAGGFELIQSGEATEKVARMVSIPCNSKIKELVFCD